MKEISDKLKEAREKKGLSINEVSVATKINSKTLQAIEDADLDNLPAKPFLRGFVQSYARYLELDVDSIMIQFTEELGTTKPKIQQEGELPPTSAESHEESQKRIELYKKLGMLAAAIIGTLLIWGIFKVIGKYEAENRIAREQREEVLKSDEPTSTESTVENNVEEKSEGTATEEKKAEEAKETPQADTPAPTNAPVAEPTPAVTAAPVLSTPPPAPTPTPVAPPAPETAQKVEVKPITPTPTPTTAAVPTTTTPPPQAPAAKTVRPQEVIIEALDNITIRYQKDNESEKSTKLGPERVLVIRAKEKITVTISDGGAATLTHNGRDKGTPGSLGQSVKLSFP